MCTIVNPDAPAMTSNPPCSTATPTEVAATMPHEATPAAMRAELKAKLKGQFSELKDWMDGMSPGECLALSRTQAKLTEDANRDHIEKGMAAEAEATAKEDEMPEAEAREGSTPPPQPKPPPPVDSNDGIEVEPEEEEEPPAAAPTAAAPPNSPVPCTPPSKKQRVGDDAPRAQTSEEKAVEDDVNQGWRNEVAFNEKLAAECAQRRAAL